MKIVQIVDQVGNKEMESYEISIPKGYMSFIHIAISNSEGQRLIIPRELMKQIIKEIE